MCGLSLAWVTSENSTKLLESDSSRLTVAGPYLLCYCLPSPVLTAPVHDSTPTLRCQVANSLVRVPRQLPLCLSRVPFPLRIRRDFMSKNPLSGFAPKQTKGSSALAAHPHSATDVLRISLVRWSVILVKFPNRFLKCSFHLLSFPSWLATFSFDFVVLYPSLTLFIVGHGNWNCLSFL